MGYLPVGSTNGQPAISTFLSSKLCKVMVQVVSKNWACYGRGHILVPFWCPPGLQLTLLLLQVFDGKVANKVWLTDVCCTHTQGGSTLAALPCMAAIPCVSVHPQAPGIWTARLPPPPPNTRAEVSDASTPLLSPALCVCPPASAWPLTGLSYASNASSCMLVFCLRLWPILTLPYLTYCPLPAPIPPLPCAGVHPQAPGPDRLPPAEQSLRVLHHDQL